MIWLVGAVVWAILAILIVWGWARFMGPMRRVN